MISKEYSEAIAETLDILEHTNMNDIDKIPKKFIDFLKENASKTYNVNLDYTKKIQDMNLKEKTIGILSIINKKYWCNNEQRKKFETKLNENEVQYQNTLKEKYSLDNLFNNNKSDKDANSESNEKEKISKNSEQLIEYNEYKWYKKIFVKILDILKFKKYMS